MEILTLIDSLEELVVQARRLPVGGNLVVDRKRILDIIDQLRLSVPGDLREAADVLENRDRILAEAHSQARALMQQAEADRAQRLDESSIMREARERSQSMLIAAEAQARQAIEEADAIAAARMSEAAEVATRELADADQYTLEVLRRLDTQLTQFLDSVRAGIAFVQERS